MPSWLIKILVQLGILKVLTPHEQYNGIHGVTLFADEYTNIGSYSLNIVPLKKLSQRGIFLRTPCSPNGFNTFQRSFSFGINNGLTTVALLDHFYNHESMMQRLGLLKSLNIKYIELFNELPHMEYSGIQIEDADDLIVKINIYSDWIHSNIPGCKVISMAPYNNLNAPEKYEQWDNYSQDELLRKIILESKVDITAVHCYGNDLDNEFRFKCLRNNLGQWHDEAEKNMGYRKSIWVTECGIDNWNKHIEYFDKWTSLFNEYFCADRVFWYRQTIDKLDSIDSQYSLHIRENGMKSPLYLA